MQMMHVYEMQENLAPEVCILVSSSNLLFFRKKTAYYGPGLHVNNFD